MFRQVVTEEDIVGEIPLEKQCLHLDTLDNYKL